MPLGEHGWPMIVRSAKSPSGRSALQKSWTIVPLVLTLSVPGCELRILRAHKVMGSLHKPVTSDLTHSFPDVPYRGGLSLAILASS